MEQQTYEDRIAKALDLDRNQRILNFIQPATSYSGLGTIDADKYHWRGTQWVNDGLPKSMHNQRVLASQKLIHE